MDLMPFVNKAGCECLNESDEHGFDNCLRKDSTFLESDCDEQVYCLPENIALCYQKDKGVLLARIVLPIVCMFKILHLGCKLVVAIWETIAF